MSLLRCLLAAVLAFPAAISGLSLPRREFLEQQASFGLLAAAASDGTGSGGVAPVCVIGANGKTGTKCVQGLVERGLPARATSRSGIYNDAEMLKGSDLLSTLPCDVRDVDSIRNAVTGTRGVIFAASASTSQSGGPSAEVENKGLISVAQACIDLKVPHLVVVSSCGVSKPSSSTYLLLNLFGGKIMENKIIGEDTVRSMYRGQTDCTYTIVRPGGLTEDPARGASALELNQGDTKSGRISRYDVASLCIEAINYPRVSGGTTFECYDADTGKPINEVGLSNLFKKKVDPDEYVTGFERRGDTWDAIFTGLVKD